MKAVALQHFDLLIGGHIKPSISKEYFDAINPSTGEVLAKIANASLEDMKATIESARWAFDNNSWGGLAVPKRGEYLKRVAQLIREHAKELAELESLDTGKTIKQTTFIDVPTAADTFEYFGNLTTAFDETVNPVPAPVKSLTRREPMGVVGCIIPWNYPLIMAAWKIAPALIAGNTVVFKPSSAASVSILRLAQIIESAELPPGVLNIVSSNRHEAVSFLAQSPLVDMVSFTGGTETGREIMKLAAVTTKKISLELGGKSPNIVFADCDMEAALGGTTSSIFMNQGQMCTAGSRLLLEDKIYDEFLRRLVEKTKKIKIGPALSYETDFGPLISQGHRDKVLKDIQSGVSEGAKLICGGKIPQGQIFSKGAFLEPAIFVDVDNKMKIAQQEIFGPVLTVVKFSGIDEAIRLANDSKYGLASCIWTKDLKKANDVAGELKCGVVWINTYGGFYNEASFGGYKQSGFGRELGLDGLWEYTQSKHICLDQSSGGMPLVAAWF